jgi:MoaA/NifB/PqqE/SkfB family radical SAM enzyme
MLYSLDRSADLVHHKVAQVIPQVIQPQPRSLFITVTANCNFACKGCHYGRDFMTGHQLPLDIVLRLLDDAKEVGLSIRFYGGEPLAHKDLPKMIAHAEQLGLKHWITTNGLLLKNRIDELYEAGAREISLGYYGGSAAVYDAYVQRVGAHKRVEEGVAYTREKYGDKIALNLAWLLMRPTCTSDAISELWLFAKQYRMPIYVNLVHYSLPYFLQPGQAGWEEYALNFTPSDRPRLEEVVAELIRLREQDPELLPQPLVGLRSIPDWLIKGPAMKVPCMARRLIWVGADGTVQLCYVTFKLGNLHENRLRDMLFTATHRQAARDAFNLNCPNCHCSYDHRVMAHGPSRKQYSITS